MESMNSALLTFSVILLLFLVILPLETKGVNFVECYCLFDGKPIISSGENMKSCIEQCGRVVGGQSDCENDCEKCCEGWCSKVSEESSKEPCITSCTKTCDFKKFMGEFISLFYVLSGIVAAAMVVFHGLRLISAEDAKKRDVAKKSILYLFIALIIIAIGGAVIDSLMKGIIQPENSKQIESVEGCGGLILNVQEEISGDKMTLSVPFTNNGDKTCYYRVGLYDLKGTLLVMNPSNIGQIGPSEVFITASGEIKTARFVQPKEKIQNGWSINLFACTAELPASSLECLDKKDTYTYSGAS